MASAAAAAGPAPQAPRRILFVPQGGQGGVGEYARCLTLAHALRERWADAHVVFAVKRGTPRFTEDPFERFVLPKEPRGGALERVAWAVAPDLVVFNNRGKAVNAAAARRSGARVVYIGSVPHYRARGTTPSLLRVVDQLWILPTGEGDAQLTPRELRAWRRGGRPTVAFLDALFAPPDPRRAARQRAELGLVRDGYSLFVPGGGGWRVGGRPCVELYLEAAEQTAQHSGLPSVLVLGPLAGERPTPREGVQLLGPLRQTALMDLVSEARVVVTGGGGLLNQALACGAACVAAPLHAGDQPARIAAAQARGLLVAAEPTAESLAEAAMRLLGSAERREALRKRLAEVGPRNERTRCIALLAPLLEAGARPCPWWLRPVRPLRR